MGVLFNNVTKSFWDADHQLTVIDRLSHSFPVGESIAIVGPSGVGKSTLLNLLGGLEMPTSGSITISGVTLGSLKEEALASFRGENIGFVFQFHHLLQEFNALENVAMPLLIAGQSETQAFERAANLLTRVGLEDRKNHRPGQLSGGEQQRVSVARAVVAAPPLILADEPTGNLDSVSAQVVSDLLLTLQRENNSTLIVVTHSRELAGRLDRCLEMKPGGALVNLD
jgi:lipoprotein-releasing system ATP-binding protein